MITKDCQPSKVHLFHYMVASADMYYAEEGQCDVYVGKEENGHLRIWGQTAWDDPSAKMELCQVFLEYGLYCSAWWTLPEAYSHMQDFGERLGHGFANYLQANAALPAIGDPALCALEQIFESVGVEFTEENIGGGVRFLVTQCPVESAARRSGVSHVELARHGMNAMCRSLLLDINPHLIVEMSPDFLPQFSFTIRTAELA